METTKKNQKVIIEGFNHGEHIETDVHSITQASGKWIGKVCVNDDNSHKEFAVMYQPCEDVWEYPFC